MFAQYPARYRDAQGEEITTIENNGKQLRMRVRGVEFAGSTFDAFEPILPAESPQRALFALTSGGDLCGCTITCEMPLLLVVQGEEEQGQLHIEVDSSEPHPLPALRISGEKLSLFVSDQRLSLRVSFGGETFQVRNDGDFEGLYDLQCAFPEGVYIKACINCAFSDYSPMGQDTFGTLACFRDNKAGYRQVTGKRGIFEIWHTMTETVQETYLCPEFERRQRGTGYRG